MQLEGGHAESQGCFQEAQPALGLRRAQGTEKGVFYQVPVESGLHLLQPEWSQVLGLLQGPQLDRNQQTCLWEHKRAWLHAGHWASWSTLTAGRSPAKLQDHVRTHRHTTTKGFASGARTLTSPSVDPGFLALPHPSGGTLQPLPSPLPSPVFALHCLRFVTPPNHLSQTPLTRNKVYSSRRSKHPCTH